MLDHQTLAIVVLRDPILGERSTRFCPTDLWKWAANNYYHKKFANEKFEETYVPP
jgi:hypothetical protein